MKHLTAVISQCCVKSSKGEVQTSSAHNKKPFCLPTEATQNLRRFVTTITTYIEVLRDTLRIYLKDFYYCWILLNFTKASLT